MKNIKTFDSFLNENLFEELGYPNGIGVNSQTWKDLVKSLYTLNPKPTSTYTSPKTKEQNINFNPPAAGPDFGMSIGSNSTEESKKGPRMGARMPSIFISGKWPKPFQKIIELADKEGYEYIWEDGDTTLKILYDPKGQSVKDLVQKILNIATGKA